MAAPKRSIADPCPKTASAAGEQAYIPAMTQYILFETAIGWAGLAWGDIQPVYLAPADGRAAFESKKVDAWVIWDPYLAAIEKSIGVRVLADGTPDVVNNYGYYLGGRDFVAKNPQVVQALFEDSVERGAWLKQNLHEAAQIIGSLQGLPVDVAEAALQRYEFNVQPVTPAVAADQQKIADTFFALKLIPKAIKVSDAVAFTVH